MSLPEPVRRSFVQRMLDHLDSLSATEWEARGHHVAQMMLQSHMRHRGQTVRGNPVGYTVDSYSWKADAVAEFSVEPRYFVDLKKPQHDYEHARTKHPNAQVVLLMSTQAAKSGAASNIANWESEVVDRDGVWLFVADAQEIAEFFASEVVPNQSASDALAPFFEPLRHLQAEYAATHTIPAPRLGALPRGDLEDLVSHAVDAHKVVVLSGMSGLGKSETAIAVATARGKRHDWRVWVRRDQITTVTDLQAVDVTQRGVKLNLMGMLRTRRCLLIVDDVPSTIPLDQLVAALRAECGPDSAALITSQLSHDGPENVEMPFMGDGDSRTLLQEGTGEPCPQELIDSLLNGVRGHPMALRMLNGSAREGLPWLEVAYDAARVGSLPVIERPGVLASVILERWRGTIEDALGFFVWSRSSRVHEDLCRRSVSYAAIRTVRRLGFFAADQPGAVRLHDIAWAAARALKPAVRVNDAEFSVAVDQYVRELSREDSGTLALNQLARLHQDVLSWSVYAGLGWYGHLYAWLHHPGPGTVSAASLPNPIELASTVADSASDDFAVQAAAELAEASLRLRIQEGSAESAAPSAEELLLPFDVLLGSANVSLTAQYHVRHHRAKALKRLKRWQEASDACEALLRDAGPLASTRLLLARTLSEYPWQIATPESGARARELLTGLLDEAKAAPERASVSVTLAAAELLRRNAVHADFDHVFAQYERVLERTIIEAAERGLEQATLAFGALGAEWARRDVAGFKRVFAALPIPAASEIRDWDEAIAWGEVLKAAAETELAPRREELLYVALDFFARSKKRYAVTHLADTRILLGQPEEAVRILDDLLANDSKAETDAWVYQRRSEARQALGDEAGALTDASKVCALLSDANRHAPYLLKWYARRLAVARLPQQAQEQLERLRAWFAVKGRSAEWSDADAFNILRVD